MRSLSVRARTTLIAVIAFGVAATIASIGLVVTLRAFPKKRADLCDPGEEARAVEG